MVFDVDGCVVFVVMVEFEDFELGDIVKYQIVGDDEVDIDYGLILVSLLIVCVLIGKFEGDVVVVQVLSGVCEYEIILVSYI